MSFQFASKIGADDGSKMDGRMNFNQHISMFLKILANLYHCKCLFACRATKICQLVMLLENERIIKKL